MEKILVEMEKMLDEMEKMLDEMEKMLDEMEKTLDGTMKEQKSQEGSNYKSFSPCPSPSLSYLPFSFPCCVCA